MAGTIAPTEPTRDRKRLGDRHRLLVWLGESVQRWSLPASGDALVGRVPTATVRIDVASISRQHARLSLEPGGAVIVDVGSQNGTRVNGERLTGPRALSYGDIIVFGDVTAVFTEDTDQPSATEAAAAGERVVVLGDQEVSVLDPAMHHVYTQLGRLAPSDLSVLILGETGTGKELAASAVRLWSKRWDRPFVTINCAALPETLAESELFGYERGAFSGAVGPKPGLIESANTGTLFLDEVGDLPLLVQAKLLRVVERKRVTRLGSVQERSTDVRFVAATHRNLEEGVRLGWFRQDLYYRLTVAVVRIPPLRERRREIPALARRFLEEGCRSLGRPLLVLGQGALERLLAHPWPGNVRELKNLMDYLSASVTGRPITADDLAERLDGTPPVEAGASAALRAPLPPAVVPQPPPAFGSLADASRDFERRNIEEALAATKGNKTQAARLLGVPLRTFMKKVKRHGL